MLKNSVNHFPLSVAMGSAFCNRIDEIKHLQNCMMNKRPVLLISPRRYGKTSLALRAISQLKLPYAHIDLFSAVDDQDIEKCILRGVGTLISQMESLPKKAYALASEFFEGTHIRVALTKLGVAIEVVKEREKPAYRVLDLLERLEKLAKKTKKEIVLFFDEFQVIREIAQDHAMEAVLRQVAQLTQSISFIFSGNNRHLLNELFEDRNRPFYKLCERITIDRIQEAPYSKHIQVVAKARWKRELTTRELDAIFFYSERHPYYLNLLCSRLLMTDNPNVEAIEKEWMRYTIEERSNVASEIELLSKNQRKLLVMLSRANGTVEPLGKEFVQKTNMPKATIEQSLNFLEKKDYLFKEVSGRVNVLDPLIKWVLSNGE